ncbi:hypothetical protein [Flavobacterium sp.]|uniref:hypothetical protein n=1 Tax=Flavobacterium sp. TaxID=239 RepID=UPI0037503C69
MKLKITLIAFTFISYLGFSQDIIIRKNGSEIKSKVTEISESAIKYKKWDNIEGPVYSIQISLVSMIKYVNGQQEVFDDSIKSLGTNNQNDNIVEPARNVDEAVKKYPKLPLKEIPYYLNDENNSLTELESTSSKTERLHSGAWGHVTIISISGITSNIRISKRDNLQFLIQFDDSKENPNTLCELVPCVIKGQRQFVDYKEGAHGKIKQNGIPIQFKKINNNGLYLITLSKNLSKGEYFFSMINQNEVYAFGLDK